MLPGAERARPGRLVVPLVTLVVGALQGSFAGRAKPLAPQANDSDHLVIDVAGDVLAETFWAPNQDLAHFLDGVHDEFSRADLVFLNLEEPITSRTKATKDRKEVAARRDWVLHAGNTAIPAALEKSGVGLVGLANNHMFDFGGGGVSDTLRAFAKAELPVVGAGFESDAERPFIFEKKGRRVALLAFSDVVPPGSKATAGRLGIASAKDPATLVAAIHRARQAADIVVLMMHWGGQGDHLITPRQRKLGRIVAEAGCDAVVGMHPHVLQGIEYVGRTPVLYSIGNFAVPSAIAAKRESVVARLVFGADGLDHIELVPVLISTSGAPQVAQERQAAQILSHLDGYCGMFNSQVSNGQIERGTVRQRLAYQTVAHVRRKAVLSARARRKRRESKAAPAALAP